LQEKPDGECIFLEGNDCTVQSVKPQQCRDFPNLWNFPGFEKTCHAILREVSAAEYQRRMAQIKLTGATSMALVGDNVLPASCRQD
jgi:Fe-S-cluster containining protein